MWFLEQVASDNCVQICFHKLENQVEILHVVGFDDLTHLDHILVASQFLEEHNLPEGALCIGVVMECVEHFFDRNLLLVGLADSSVYHPISTLPQLLDDVVLVQNMLLEVLVLVAGHQLSNFNLVQVCSKVREILTLIEIKFFRGNAFS